MLRDPRARRSRDDLRDRSAVYWRPGAARVETHDLRETNGHDCGPGGVETGYHGLLLENDHAPNDIRLASDPASTRRRQACTIRCPWGRSGGLAADGHIRSPTAASGAGGGSRAAGPPPGGRPPPRA